jgi:hypothetical protein
MSDEEVHASRWVVVFFGVENRPVTLLGERVEIDDVWITLYRDGHPIKLFHHEVKAIRRIKEEHEQPEEGAGDGSGEGDRQAS